MARTQSIKVLNIEFCWIKMAQAIKYDMMWRYDVEQCTMLTVG